MIVTQVWAMEWVALAETAGLTVIGMSHESYGTCRNSSRFQRVQRFYKDVDRMLALTREDADRWIGLGESVPCRVVRQGAPAGTRGFAPGWDPPFR